jgi:hypothetical protein
MEEMISEHISLEEATKSVTAIRNGIDNTPSLEVAKSMILVATKCFEPLRKWYGKPIRINSFFRSWELNKLVGGSLTSGHVLGNSIDMDAGEDNKKIFDWCKDNLEFTQLIWEYGTDVNPDWVHISYDKNNLKKQILRIK